MPNMSNRNHLKTLTRQEAMVLYWKCRGSTYKRIAVKLGYGEDRIAQIMSSVYKKLGFSKEMHWTERVRPLNQVFCKEFMALIRGKYENLEEWPLYGVPVAGDIVRVGKEVPKETAERTPLNPPEEPVPDPEMMALVLYDEKQMAARPEVVQGEVVVLEPKKPGNDGGCRGWVSRALVGLGVLVVIAGLAGAAYYFGTRQGQRQAPTPAPTLVVPADSLIPTREPPTAASTSALIPTETPTPQPSPTPLPTNTPYPTNTPKPSISLPFADDFSNGINPPWSVYSGKWLTTGTGATITITDKDPDTGALILDDPTLTDYRLTVKVHSPGVLSACQGDLGVVVRYQADRDQNLMYFMNSASRFYWGYTDSLSPSFGSLTQITDVVKANIISDFVMELEASGNDFTARIDGAKYDSFSLTGYETGGVALVPVCGCPGYCPSFSNFSLEPLP